jgi:hypothetical protein
VGTANLNPPAESVPQPTRVKGFASFFKGYMDLWSVVTAALPIPVTSLSLIPTYKAYTPVLSTYAPLFCFLLLGYVFYTRHRLAWLYFGQAPTFAPRRAMTVLPAALILLSFVFVFSYHIELRNSLVAFTGNSPKYLSSKEILKTADYREIPHATELMILYLGIFLSAELAFIIMATREYLQDAIPIREKILFGGIGYLPEPGPPPCLVFFKSTPDGCEVLLDGERVGETPCSKSVSVGTHDVRMRKWGLQDYQGPLLVSAGDPTCMFEVRWTGDSPARVS